MLHRDLKPGNVMIDGRGRAKITDFGLAVGVDDDKGGAEVSGTPAYMAPEQLAGKGASVQSDIYALGLVLYELFTGRKAFEAATLAEWRRKHAEEQPTSPSTVTPGFDPVVERVILRCLEKDPKARPRSVAAVWTGRYPDLLEIAVRVEAAAYRGKPVSFQVVFPWKTPSSGDAVPAGGAGRTANLLGVTLFLACIVGGLVVARRNLVSGRGDRRGASRLAVVIVVVYLAGYVFAGHHVLATSEMDLMIKATAWSLFAGGLTWLLYLALEPHVRRRWPHTLISWSRLLAGRSQDPLVGRDVLIGSAVGVGLMLLTYGGSLVRAWWTGTGGAPSLTLLSPLMGPGSLLGALCFHIFSATFGVVSLFFLLFLLRLVVRRDILAAAVFVIMIVAQNVLISSSPVVDGAIAAVLGALLVLLLFDRESSPSASHNSPSLWPRRLR